MAKATESNAVGRRIRALREAKGWTQGDLGTRLKTTGQAVSAIERGCEGVGISMLRRLGDVFGRAARMELAELLNGAKGGR